MMIIGMVECPPKTGHIAKGELNYSISDTHGRSIEVENRVRASNNALTWQVEAAR